MRYSFPSRYIPSDMRCSTSGYPQADIPLPVPHSSDTMVYPMLTAVRCYQLIPRYLIPQIH